MTDLQSTLRVIDLLFGIVVLGISGWASILWMELKAVRERNHQQESKINDLSVQVSGTYVSRVELDRHVLDLRQTLQYGFDKIDKRMDKIHDELREKQDRV